MADDYDDDYEVGYGKPPKETQFKKGQSGNPKGRPRGTRNFKTDLKAELEQPIQITEGGVAQIHSKQAGLIKRMMEMALKGNIRAAELITKWTQIFLDLDTDVDHSKPVSDKDQKLIERALDRLEHHKTKPDDGENDD